MELGEDLPVAQVFARAVGLEDKVSWGSEDSVYFDSRKVSFSDVLNGLSGDEAFSAFLALRSVGLDFSDSSWISVVGVSPAEFFERDLSGFREFSNRLREYLLPRFWELSSIAFCFLSDGDRSSYFRDGASSIIRVFPRVVPSATGLGRMGSASQRDVLFSSYAGLFDRERAEG